MLLNGGNAGILKRIKTGEGMHEVFSTSTNRGHGDLDVLEMVCLRYCSTSTKSTVRDGGCTFELVTHTVIKLFLILFSLLFCTEEGCFAVLGAL